MSDFTGKIFMITGATGNVGREVASKLFAAGAHLILVGRSIELDICSKLPELAAHPEKVAALDADLASAGTLASMPTVSCRGLSIRQRIVPQCRRQTSATGYPRQPWLTSSSSWRRSRPELSTELLFRFTDCRSAKSMNTEAR